MNFARTAPLPKLQKQLSGTEVTVTVTRCDELRDEVTRLKGAVEKLENENQEAKRELERINGRIASLRSEGEQLKQMQSELPKIEAQADFRRAGS